MKLIKITLIPLFLLILFSTCKKENYDIIKVKGVVLSTQENLPIDSVEVFLQKGDGIIFTSYKTVATCQTDQQGKFEIDYKEEYNFDGDIHFSNNFQLIFKKENYSNTSIEIETSKNVQQITVKMDSIQVQPKSQN